MITTMKDEESGTKHCITMLHFIKVNVNLKIQKEKPRSVYILKILISKIFHTCKHGVKIRTTGGQHHSMSRNFHVFSHNCDITQQILTVYKAEKKMLMIPIINVLSIL